MPRKKPVSTPKKRIGDHPPDLTEIERDLLSHMESGYQLETDSLGSNLVLRKGDEVIRPASANRNTVKALEEHGLISPAKSRDPLTMVWRMTRKRK
jgi:hypothetical protein